MNKKFVYQVGNNKKVVLCFYLWPTDISYCSDHNFCCRDSRCLAAFLCLSTYLLTCTQASSNNTDIDIFVNCNWVDTQWQ